MSGNKLFAPGELTEGQFAVCNEFLRLIAMMQERLSAGLCALERVGIQVDGKPFERAFWDLAVLTDPIDKAIIGHLDAQIAAHLERVKK